MAKTARQLGQEGLGFAAALAAMGLSPADANDEFTIEWSEGRREAESAGRKFRKPVPVRCGIRYPGVR